MSSTFSTLPALLSTAVFAISCASTSARPSFRDVSADIEARTGQKIYWNQGTDDDRKVEQTVRDMLGHELTVDAAVQIALLNNRGMQSLYEELSIAQADVVQAGLLRNPVFSASVRPPISGGGRNEVELSVVADFLDVLMIPARKKIAKGQLAAAKLRVADEVLRLDYDVQQAYYTAQSAEQLVSLRRALLEAGQASVELATRQHEAGNISDLDLANYEVLSEQLALDLARSEGEALTARESMNRLLGLWGPQVSWKIANKLPELPKDDPPLDQAETIAITRRFDLAAMHEDRLVVADLLSMVKTFRWISGSSVGLSYAQLNEGPKVLGPSASLELPLFDQKQAVIARLEAQLKQAILREQSLAIDIRSEVRLARARVVLARDVVERYRKKLVPLRERVVQLSQTEYDAMLLGVHQLLLAKQNEILAYRELIESLRDYWIARSALERAVGGHLPC